MKVVTIIQIVLALVSGVLLVGYGGMDDSPGAQGIGLLTVMSSIFVGVHFIRARSH